MYGSGVGLATAPLTSVVLRDVPVGDGGRASGTQSTSRQLGSALGIAVVGTLFSSTAQSSLTSSGADGQVVSAVVDSSGGAIASLTGAVQTAAQDALSDGTRLAAFAAAAFLLVGLLATRSLAGNR